MHAILLSPIEKMCFQKKKMSVNIVLEIDIANKLIKVHEYVPGITIFFMYFLVLENHFEKFFFFFMEINLFFKIIPIWEIF